MTKRAPFPQDITLQQLQEYVRQINIDRGFNTTDASKKLVLLTEEVGELAKAVRKSEGMKFTSTTRQTDLEEELADVLIVLLGLTSLLGLDIVAAVQKKETKNLQRKWV